MFRELIRNPIDPIPQAYIDTLTRLEGEPDFSLSCLGVAVLKDRIEDYKGISGIYKYEDHEGSCLANLTEQEGTLNDCPKLCYYMYSKPKENAEEELIERGYEIKEKIGAFLKEKADVKCIAASHKEKNIAVILIASRDIKYYHLLISFLSLLFPSIFKGKELKDKDYDIIKSLSRNDKNAFIQRIQEAVQPYVADFRRMMLNSLLKSMHEIKINQALNDVDEQRRIVESFKVDYANAIHRLKDAIVIYEGMKATEVFDKPEEELVEYLSINKQVRNLSITGSKITFSVATRLSNYNADAWETYSRAGHIFEGRYGNAELLDVFKDKKNRKILLDSIFSETPEFAVNICSNYQLDFDSCRIDTDRGYDYDSADPTFKNYLPNPHLKLFSCFGQYSPRIIDCLRKREYISAFELCCASAGSVNIDETEQTFKPFIGWLLASRNNVLHRKDGIDMTPEEALVYLIDKEKENETDKNE